MRLLRITAGGLRLALDLKVVESAEAVEAHVGDRAAVSVARAVGAEPGPEQVHIGVRSRAGRALLLAVDAAGDTFDSNPLPLPPLLDGPTPAFPVAGAATPLEGLTLVLDCDSLGESGGAGVNVRAAPANAAWPAGVLTEYAVLPAVPSRTGEPLMVGVAGAFRLRGRPLALALPLRSTLRVTPSDGMVRLPLPPPLVGLALYDGTVVPVIDPAQALGWPANQRGGGKLVFYETLAGPAALQFDTITGTAQPLHLAPPETMAPLESSLIVGAVPTRQRWIAVLGRVPDDDGELMESTTPAA